MLFRSRPIQKSSFQLSQVSSFVNVFFQFGLSWNSFLADRRGNLQGVKILQLFKSSQFNYMLFYHVLLNFTIVVGCVSLLHYLLRSTCNSHQPLILWGRFDHDDRFPYKRLPALGNLDDVSPIGSNFSSMFLATLQKR